MSIDETKEQRQGRPLPVEGGADTRKPYEPPRLEPRGKVERTTLVSGCQSIAPGPGC